MCCGKVVGAVKMVAVELGVARLAEEPVVATRRKVCEACPSWEHGRCLTCRCYTWAKTKMAGEKCPEGKW